MACHIQYEVEEEAGKVFLESFCENSPLKFNNLDTSSVSDTGHWAKKIFLVIVVPTRKMTRKRYFL